MVPLTDPARCAMTPPGAARAASRWSVCVTWLYRVVESQTERVVWKPYDQMIRLEQKMFWAVRESAMLHELPLPEVDNPGSAGEVVWSAERPEDCAAVLLEWFDAGLVAVMTTEAQEDLDVSDGREVLADYAAWSPAHSLVITDAGEAALG